MRETFSVGLSDLGDGLTWGEARILIEDAASDPSTALGAELAGWAYQATMPQLLSLVAQVGDKRASRRVMPWVMERPGRGEAPSADEVAAAEAALEAEYVFT